MKCEWKTGDVAISGDEFVTLSDEGVWYWATTALPCLDQPPANLRPLVVIDPEDREQVKALLRAYGNQFSAWTPELDGPGLSRLQNALRSLITPPKPEEPTGLGAVVEDERGELWVRRTAPPHWNHAKAEAFPVHWNAITAVRILSEGVQPC